VKVLLVSPMPPPYGGISHWTSMILGYSRMRPGAAAIRVLDTAPRRVRLETSTGARVLEGAVRMCADVGRFAWVLMRHRPAIVHLNTSGQLAFVRDLVMLTVADWVGVPVVYHLRFGRLADIASAGTREWGWAKRAVARASAVIALDSRTELCLRDQTGAKKVVRIPNPVQFDRIPESAADRERGNVVLFVGWIIRTKGVEELLQAWKRLDPPDWTLELVGPADQEYLRHLRADRLPTSVRFLGKLESPAVIQRMHASRVFAFPSHTEGFPNAVAEAMASGLAIVASDVGAIGSMLAGSAGILVPAQNVDSLVTGLRRVLESPAERTALATRAREKALREYSLDRIFDDYVALWSELADLESNN
jgi:glycosyltransferase involved in cell wall biosynthesis